MSSTTDENALTTFPVHLYWLMNVRMFPSLLAAIVGIFWDRVVLRDREMIASVVNILIIQLFYYIIIS